MAKIPTIRVRRRSDSAICQINEVDFDPTLHQHVNDPPEPPKATRNAPPKPAAANVAPPAVSRFTRDELAAMSVEKLRQLPEWQLIDGRGTKGELVDKLLAAREEAFAKAEAAAHAGTDA